MRAALGWLALCALGACGPSDGPDPAADAIAGADGGAGCAVRAADGACCPAGAVLGDDGTCVALGPPSCGAHVATSGAGAQVAALAACVPRWCADWQDATGASCDPSALGCLPSPRACSQTELDQGAGCPAGEWPTATGACALPGRADRSADDQGHPLAPKPPHLSWCWDLMEPGGGGCDAPSDTCWPTARACTPAERAAGRGCAEGTWPRSPQTPEAPDCVPAGVPWTCPEGFVPDPTGEVPPGGLGACRADPGRCGAGPWPSASDPAGQLPADTVYVSALAAPGGDGTSDKPFRTVSEGVDAAPTGGTVAIAAGLYDEALLLKRPVHLRGRCAALVRVRSADVAVLGVNAKAQPGVATVRDLALTSTDSAGVNVRGPLHVKLTHVWVDGPRLFGFNVDSQGAALTLTDSLVSRVRVKTAGYAKCGQTGDFGRLHLVRSRLTGCRISGLDVTGKGSATRLSEVLIDGVQTQEGTQDWGDGISIRNGATLRARGLRIHGTHLSGVANGESSGGCWLHGVQVDSVFTGGLDNNATSGLFARALSSTEFAGFVVRKVPFVGVLLVGSQNVGVFGGLVEDTLSQAETGEAGLGLMAWQGAQVEISDLRVRRARSMGVRVRGAGTRVRASRLVVTATQPRIADQSGGGGVHVLDKGRLDLTDAYLESNHWIGIFVRDAGSVLHAARVFVGDMRSAPKGTTDGEALVVVDAGEVRMTQLYVTGARTVGALVDMPGSKLALAGAYIARSKLDMLGHFGRGVWVQAGARLELVGSRVTTNVESGVGCTSVGSEVVISGARVDHHTPGAGERGHGMGVVTGSGCSALVVDSLIDANHSAGVAFHLGDGSVLRSVVRGTLGAGYTKTGDETVVLADGIVAREVAKLDVAHTLTFGHERAGVLVDAAGAPSAVKLTGVASVGNLFGLVAQGPVTTVKSGTLLSGNTAQNEVSDQALSLAPPPDAATFEP